MVIQVVKLASGDEIIGTVYVKQEMRFVDEVGERYSGVHIENPMSIVGDDGEYALRLRNTLLLSDDDKIIVDLQHVIMIYGASTAMVKYYHTALEYANTYTKPMVAGQIEYSTQDLQQRMADLAETQNDVIEKLAKVLGSEKTKH